jgi:hypothetical protein
MACCRCRELRDDLAVGCGEQRLRTHMHSERRYQRLNIMGLTRVTEGLLDLGVIWRTPGSARDRMMVSKRTTWIAPKDRFAGVKNVRR